MLEVEQIEKSVLPALLTHQILTDLLIIQICLINSPNVRTNQISKKRTLSESILLHISYTYTNLVDSKFTFNPKKEIETTVKSIKAGYLFQTNGRTRGT